LPSHRDDCGQRLRLAVSGAWAYVGAQGQGGHVGGGAVTPETAAGMLLPGGVL